MHFLKGSCVALPRVSHDSLNTPKDKHSAQSKSTHSKTQGLFTEDHFLVAVPSVSAQILMLPGRAVLDEQCWRAVPSQHVLLAIQKSSEEQPDTTITLAFLWHS